MSLELLFLGTGAGVPSKDRNVSAIALTLLQEINSIWLFDCGEATQHQILQTTIKPRKITKIFITHMHGDHIYGLPGLLSSRSFQGGDELLTIYGPAGIKEFVETSLSLSKTHLTYPLHIEEIREGKLFAEEKYTVYCKQLEHGIPSYGFRIVEHDKPGALQAEKLQAIGIKPGPIYQQLKENDVVVTNEGQTLHRDQFLGPTKRGNIISILGDTRSTEKNATFVENSDILVHEATFNHKSSDLAKKYFHSTTTEAATLAKTASIKKLVLTHISSRYQTTDLNQLLSEARAVFPNTVIAHDFSRIKISNE